MDKAEIPERQLPENSLSNVSVEDANPDFLISTFKNKPVRTMGSLIWKSGKQERICEVNCPKSSGMDKVELPDRDLTEKIICAAIAVHTALGPGFSEPIYEEALCIELEFQSIPFERQMSIRMAYRDHMIGEHRLDLLVAKRVVVELKAAKALELVHFAIVRSYMKATGTESGLLLNFASMPLTIKRVGRGRQS